MIGRKVGVVADAMALVHGLCGQSHAAAVHCAAAAATGGALPRGEIERWVVRLAGERLGEHLRSVFMLRGDLSAERVAALRAAIAVGQSAVRYRK